MIVQTPKSQAVEIGRVQRGEVVKAEDGKYCIVGDKDERSGIINVFWLAMYRPGQLHAGYLVIPMNSKLIIWERNNNGRRTR